MNRIASERKMLGMTQGELADELGVDTSTIVRWESGGSVSQSALIQMRSLFGVDLDWLLGLSDTRNSLS